MYLMYSNGRKVVTMTVSQATAAPLRGPPLDQLRRQIAAVEGWARAADAGVLSTGVPGLDALLPRGGLRRGVVVEWLGSASAGGAQTLALLAAREACREGKSLMVVDRQRRFYPPAAAAWGIDLARLIVIHPASEADELWTIDQALRCRGVAAVWARRDKLDSRDFRRLQLAAESGETLGLLIRSARVRGEPSWADLQFVVSPQRSPLAPRRDRHAESLPYGWRLHVELTRCRGSQLGQSVDLEIDEWTGRVLTQSASKGASHETHPLRPAPDLASSAAGCRIAV
jgi:protein ImuA